MKVSVVLPTGRRGMAGERQAAYAAWTRPGTDIQAVSLSPRVPVNADPSDAFLLPEILDRVCQVADDGADAVILDCMEDPGVEQGRRLVRIPVIGPGQAAFHLAAMLGYRFSVLYPLPQVSLIESLVRRLGLMEQLASVRVLPCGLEGLQSDKNASVEDLATAALAAIEEDGAHVIIPACTLTANLTTGLAQRLANAGHEVPVVNGPAAAVKLAEDLHFMGISHSRITYPESLGISRRIG